MRAKQILFTLLATLAVGSNAQMAPIPEETKQLGYLVGTWEGEAKLDFMGPDAKGKASFVGKMGVGGRYLVMEHKYEIPQMGDMNGLQVTGYDAETKEWVSWWYDSMEFGSMELRGTSDGPTQTVTSKPSKVGGMDNISIRQVLKKISDTKIEVVLTMKQGDEWGPMMTVTYTKK